MWATLETHPVPREWSPACFWPHPQCPPTGQLCEVPDSPDTLEAVTWRRSKSNHRGQTCASFFLLLFFIGPTNVTLYPGPLFLCALAVETFPPMPFPHLVSFPQKLKAFAYYLLWVCVKVPWQENMHMTF